MCVQFCPSKALSFIAAKNRKKGHVENHEPEKKMAATTLSHDFFKPESEQGT